MWEDELENVTENNEKTLFKWKKTYYWLSYDGLSKIISMNPYDSLESEYIRKYEKRNFLLTILDDCVVMVEYIQ